MLSNLSRTADSYGNVHFISLYGTILSRLAYCNDNTFLPRYNQIFGPVIVPEIMQSIDAVSASNIKAEMNDQNTFKLNTATDPLNKYSYAFKTDHFIAFNALNIPQNVNIINGEISGTPTYAIEGKAAAPDDVKYISIGWSNYGEIYVVADKRMPKTLFVLFRGTYSAKTAALYSKPTSLVPISNGCGKDEGFLYGIFKPSVEMIHTLIESMTYLATHFLNATQANTVKVFTAGHSLGGAMCTNFAYLWTGIMDTPPYNSAPYNVFAKNIICISLGAPRCLGTKVANKFCDLVKQNKIVYLRITTRGDPIPGLPPKSGYDHACSSDPTTRAIVSEDCNANLTARGTINVNYSAQLDCQNFKTRPYVPNPLSHAIYLNILYVKAVDIINFLKGIGIANEVKKTSTGGSMARLIVGNNNQYKSVFFDLSNAREKNFKKADTFGGPVNEDVCVTKPVFDSLMASLNSSTPLAAGNYAPMSGTVVNPFNLCTTPMPRLSCVHSTSTPAIATTAPATTTTPTPAVASVQTTALPAAPAAPVTLKTTGGNASKKHSRHRIRKNQRKLTYKKRCNKSRRKYKPEHHRIKTRRRNTK